MSACRPAADAASQPGRSLFRKLRRQSLTRRHDALGPLTEFDREQQRQAFRAKPLQFLRSGDLLR
jgi:hypothetical protein